MNAIIFGANGQDGIYLSELCAEKQIEVTGISRSGSGVNGDVGNLSFTEEIIKRNKPDFVFHLAANSTTKHYPVFENHSTISNGTLNILESVYKYSSKTKVFITGSGVQFVNDGTPISENTPFEASSPYSVSRIQSVYAARYYRSLGIKAYTGYLFHHESPLRKAGHMSQKIVSFAKDIKSGKSDILEVGDLSVEKEWTYAGDTVRAIFTLVNQDDVFEAVIGTGVSHSIKDWLNECFSLLGLDWQKHIRQSENFSPEYKKLVSAPKVIMSLGWKPLVNFKTLAEIMLGLKSA
jgi:GDP-D-mannose dehydratase